MKIVLPKIITISALIILTTLTSALLIGCSTSTLSTASSTTTASTVASTTKAASPTISQPPAPSSSAAADLVTKSGDGAPVTAKSALVGSWAQTGMKAYLPGGLTQTRSYPATGADSYLFVFDLIKVVYTHGSTTLYSGEWDLKDGTLTMSDQKPNSRPIVYSDLRLKDGILTAIFKDKDLLQVLTFQKTGN